MLKVVHEESAPNATGASVASASLLDEIVCDGARQMLAAALQAGVAAYIAARAGEVDEHGHQLVVRNGYHTEREVTTAAGVVPVMATSRVSFAGGAVSRSQRFGVSREVPGSRDGGTG